MQLQRYVATVSPLLIAALSLVLAACAHRTVESNDLAPEQQRFWANLTTLCGQAFEGRAVEGPPTDETFAGHRLVIHVRECSADEIRIPLHVGEDRSRTWIVSRTDEGLRLKHDHRHRDGTPDSNTDYGGDTSTGGTAERQEFPADAYSVAAAPARATQAWFLEVRPGEMFAYGLHRRATDLRYRMEFDLSTPVDPPPPPWGS
jgi:hypothetical protein